RSIEPRANVRSAGCTMPACGRPRERCGSSRALDDGHVGIGFLMTLVITIVAFLVALGSLIVVHELGHYFVARLCNVKVLRFSVGFGKPLWMRRLGADRTEWV